MRTNWIYRHKKQWSYRWRCRAWSNFFKLFLADKIAADRMLQCAEPIDLHRALDVSHWVEQWDLRLIR